MTRTVKIKSISDGTILFSNGDTITYDHEQDCCEWNYADFSQLDDLAKSYAFSLPLRFDYAPGGFTFGDDKRQFYVPCYSEQNGYYTTDIDIYYNGNLVISTVCDWDGEY